jgi:hypothetical protein
VSAHRPGPGRALRLLAAGLLFFDALSAALGVAASVSALAVAGLPVVAMIALRGLSGALESMGGWLLLQRSQAARPIALSGTFLAALYATFGIGARLAPTNLDPAFRLPVVFGYWAYALTMFAMLRRA